MQHYTYLLQSKTDDRMYIGVRSCKVLPECDNYWGSSKHIPKDVADTFDKFILGTFRTRKEAVADEINRHINNDVVHNAAFINKAKQTSTGWDTTGATLSEDHRESIRSSRLGYKHSEETKRKIGLAGRGRKISKEHIAKLIAGKKKMVLTPEIRARMSEGQRKWHLNKQETQEKQL